MTELYRGPERRHFVRLEYVTPLAYKICNKETIARLLQGYVSNVSEAGLLCNITERVDGTIYCGFPLTGIRWVSARRWRSAA